MWRRVSLPKISARRSVAKIHGGGGAGRLDLQGEIAADKAGHQVKVEGKAQEEQILPRAAFDQQIVKGRKAQPGADTARGIFANSPMGRSWIAS